MGNTRFNHYTQFDLEPISGTNSYFSAITDINQQHNIGIHLKFVGNMVGIIQVECSNDPDQILFEALTFDPVLLQPSGVDLSYAINVNQAPFWFLRLNYENVSGSGTITSFLTSKDLS